MSDTRRNCVAGQFYPADAASCRNLLEQYTAPAGQPPLDRPALGGIVPHAGWMYSGAVAGRVFSAIKECGGSPEVFFMFGAMHRSYSDAPAMMSSGAWDTPIGAVDIDEKAARSLLENSICPINESAEAHEDEHSLEVCVPFVKFLFPDARIVPILVPSNIHAEELGVSTGRLMKDYASGRAVAVASTDLTHYGVEYGFAPRGVGDDALKWVKEENDRSFIELATGMMHESMLDDSRKKRNACGAGAAVAACAAAKGAGAVSGKLLEYTTSHDVARSGRPTLFVGYAGIVF